MPVVEEIAQELSVPQSVVWGILALSVLILAAQIYALVDLARRQRVLWGRKWVWALIILLVSNGIGVVLWFVLGRRVPQADPESLEASVQMDSDRTQRAVDALYGERER